MINRILLSFLSLTLGLTGHNTNHKAADNAKKPIAYTIILKNVDYTNGFDLDNGIKTRSPYKCPLYYIDSLRLIEEICPDNGTSDTITIYHSQDHLELAHSIRGLDFFYYRLYSGDTLSLHYKDGIPIAENPRQNLFYNLIEDNPFQKLRELNYLVLSSTNILYYKYKTKEEVPKVLERLKPFYRNLDSLYHQTKKSHNFQIDYIRKNSDSPDYWENILNKTMRRVVLLSLCINNSDTSIYGKEGDFDVFSISDRFYYKTKFNQNPDSIFNTAQNHRSINPELARYYYQLYLEYLVDRGELLKSINNIISQYYQSFSEHRDTVFIQGLRMDMGLEENITQDIKIRNIDGVETSLDQLIKQDSASLYYIDYWASWCAPCRAEIPYSIDLKKKLEDMGIRFIYLAYNDRMDNWTKAVRELNLSNYNHSWFITNSRSSQQLMDYNIKTLPRYMILDGEGKVIVANAQRPSDPELKKLLLSSLKGN